MERQGICFKINSEKDYYQLMKLLKPLGIRWRANQSISLHRNNERIKERIDFIYLKTDLRLSYSTFRCNEAFPVIYPNQILTIGKVDDKIYIKLLEKQT